MPNNIIKTIQINYSLYNEEIKVIEEMALVFQYFDFIKLDWQNLRSVKLIKSEISETLKSSIRSEPLSYLFKMINEGNIPLLRIIPQKQLYYTDKDEVLSNLFTLEIDREKSSLLLHFGKNFLVPKNMIDNRSHIKNTIRIASEFQVFDQKQNLNELKALKNELAQSNEKLNTQKAEITIAQKSIKEKNENIENLSVEVNSLKLQNESLTQEKIKHRNDFDFQNRVSKDKAEEISRIEKELNTEKNKNNELSNNVKKLNDEIGSVKESLSKANKDIIGKDNKIKQLESQIDILNRSVNFELRPIPVNSVYRNIVDEIQKADELNNTNFKISNIQLKVRGLINNDEKGLNFQFLNSENAKDVNGDAISEVVMAIDNVPKAENEIITLPSLIGFTETAVRRILSSLGLKLNPVYQKKPNIAIGESFMQSPNINSEVQYNQLITVIFSKNE